MDINKLRNKICTECENKNWCSWGETLNCFLEKEELKEQCISIYDAEKVIENYLKKEEQFK